MKTKHFFKKKYNLTFFLQQKIELQRLFEWLTKSPPVTTFRVNLLKTNSDQIIKKIKEKLIDKYPEENVEVGLLIKELPELVLMKELSQNNDLSAIQIDHLKEIIVDTSCGAALLRGAHLYAPGVLAMPKGTQMNETVRIYSDLSGKCKKGTNVLFESDEKVLIGIGTVKMTRNDLFIVKDGTPQGIAVEMIRTVSNVPSLGDSFLPLGHSILQNLPSIVCSRVLDPQPNEIILDMCAAPGNKTTHLAELINDEGTIYAFDKILRKIENLKEKCKDYKSIQAFSEDSTKILGRFSNNYFDKILLDAPCSALGNRPQLMNPINPKTLKSYVNVQRKLFDVAVELLKPGGTLVYSTCTIHSGENEGMVSWALKKFPILELVPAEPYYGGPGWSDCGLNEEERVLVQRFGPETDPLRLPMNTIFNETVGFFISKFIKRKI